jgi:formylglycine-generating enzyme required for sulfatase activity
LKPVSTMASPAARTIPAGQEIRDCATCPVMVALPNAPFSRGSLSSEPGRRTDEGPRRATTLPGPFAVGKYEVTFDEWNACVAAGGCIRKPSDQGWGKGGGP